MYAPRYWPTWFLLGVLRIVALLPLRVSRAIGSALGTVIYVANAKRRRIARINLRLCFPDLSERTRRRLLRRHFRVAGQGYLDLGFFVWASEARVAAKVRIEGLEHVRAATAGAHAVILLAPHCIGMNVGGIAVAKYFPTFSMVKPQRNRLVD